MNDLWPIAPTSCVMQILERVVLVYIQSDVTDYIDPFAYVADRSVDDALICVLNTIYKHFEKMEFYKNNVLWFFQVRSTL